MCHDEEAACFGCQKQVRLHFVQLSSVRFNSLRLQIQISVPFISTLNQSYYSNTEIPEGILSETQSCFQLRPVVAADKPANKRAQAIAVYSAECASCL